MCDPSILQLGNKDFYNQVRGLITAGDPTIQTVLSMVAGHSYVGNNPILKDALKSIQDPNFVAPKFSKTSDHTIQTLFELITLIKQALAAHFGVQMPETVYSTRGDKGAGENKSVDSMNVDPPATDCAGAAAAYSVPPMGAASCSAPTSTLDDVIASIMAKNTISEIVFSDRNMLVSHMGITGPIYKVKITATGAEIWECDDDSLTLNSVVISTTVVALMVTHAKNNVAALVQNYYAKAVHYAGFQRMPYAKKVQAEMILCLLRTPTPATMWSTELNNVIERAWDQVNTHETQILATRAQMAVHYPAMSTFDPTQALQLAERIRNMRMQNMQLGHMTYQLNSTLECVMSAMNGELQLPGPF